MINKTPINKAWQTVVVRAQNGGGLLRSARSIVVFRALQLGDMLCAVPAFHALRHANATAEITLVGLPWAACFVDRYRMYIDQFVSFPGYPGLPEQEPQLSGLRRLFEALGARRFDLALQLHGSGVVSNEIVLSMGAAHVGGFYPSGTVSPGELFCPYPDDRHEILRLRLLIEWLGIPWIGNDIEFPIRPAEEEAARQLLRSAGLSGKRFVCIHPGARAAERRWRPEEFAAIADRLADARFSPVLTGSSSDPPLTAAVRSKMRNDAIDIAGKTDLAVLGAVLRKSSLLISNDTGISHLAAALRVPSIVLFSASDPARWAPLDASLHRAVHTADADCIFRVWSHVRDILQEETRYAA